MKIAPHSTPFEFLAHASAGVLGELTASSCPEATEKTLGEAQALAHKALCAINKKRAAARKRLAQLDREAAHATNTFDALQDAKLRMAALY